MRGPQNLVVGIDPSLTCTGVVRIEGDLDISLSTLVSHPTGHTLTDRHRRIAELFERIAEQLTDRATLVVIEAPSMARASGATHERSGLWWLLIDHFIDSGVPIVEVPPACRAKYATGKGNAIKGAVIDAVARRYPHVETRGNDNLADALILAAIGRRMIGHPIEDSLPAANLAALQTLRLPEGFAA